MNNNLNRFKMDINLNGHKVVHEGKVMRALSILYIEVRNGEVGETIDESITDTVINPVLMDVMVINEDGTVVIIRDEAWCFQFIPIIEGR